MIICGSIGTVLKGYYCQIMTSHDKKISEKHIHLWSYDVFLALFIELGCYVLWNMASRLQKKFIVNYDMILHTTQQLLM